MLKVMDNLTQQPPEHSSAQPQRISRPLVFALILLAVIIAGAGGYWLGKQKPAPSRPSQNSTPPKLYNVVSPTETAWKTFANTTYGYTLQYPKDLFVKDLFVDANKKSKDPTTSSIVSFYNPKEKTNPNVFFVIVHVLSVHNASQWIKDDIGKASRNAASLTPPHLTQVTQTSISNHQATSVEYVSMDDKTETEYVTYIIKNPNTVVLIASSYLPEGQTKTVFQKMLSSFQFSTPSFQK